METLYREGATGLARIIARRTNDSDQARDIVPEVFLRIAAFRANRHCSNGFHSPTVEPCSPLRTCAPSACHWRYVPHTPSAKSAALAAAHSKSTLIPR